MKKFKYPPESITVKQLIEILKGTDPNHRICILGRSDEMYYKFESSDEGTLIIDNDRMVTSIIDEDDVEDAGLDQKPDPEVFFLRMK